MTPLIHVAGPTAAGKTTLAARLQAEHPGLHVRDLDDFDTEARTTLLPGKPKKDYTLAEIQRHAAERQRLLDAYLQERKDAPVLLVGHHNEGPTSLDIPATHRFLLNPGAGVSVKRRYARNATAPVEKRLSPDDRPKLLAEARDVVGQLGQQGYSRKSSREIAAAVAKHMKTAASEPKTNPYVYTYVPRPAVDAILAEGLHGGKALLEHPKALKAVAASRGVPVAEFRKGIEENLKSWKAHSSLGPNVAFSPVSKDAPITDKHPTRKHDLALLRLNLEQLRRDEPKTRVYGMELIPYGEHGRRKRHRMLSKKEVAEYMNSKEDLWKRYNDLEDRGLYAADVPHAAIHSPTGSVAAKYLEKVSAAAFFDELQELLP